ncbi:MAG: tetratricopeptide repeat protein [Myxococcales bacterium]|nr:tetratricopeptide repeat protein [Myxococcales bacterium]
MNTLMSELLNADQAKAEITRTHARIQSMDHFEVLGVNRDASASEIRQQYVALARKWHTDVFAGLDLGSAATQLSEIFLRISEAHQTLSDPVTRLEYITLLDRQQAGLATDIHAILRGETMVDEGLAEMKRRQWKSAEAAFREAINLNPDDPLIWAHYAWTQYRAQGGNASAATSARKQLEKAYKQQEKLPEAYFYLGSIAFEHNDLDRAIAWLRRCLAHAPNNVEAARILRLARSRKEKSQLAKGSWLSKMLRWIKNS